VDGAVAADWAQVLVQAGLGDVQQLLTVGAPAGTLRGTWTMLSKPGLGGRERWRWELGAADGPVVYLKRYRGCGWRAQLDRVCRQTRRSRAWWEYHQAAELQRKYVPAVRAIAFAEELGWWRERRSAVLFEAVRGDGFDRVWRRLAAADDPMTRAPLRHDVARRLGRFVSAFHQTGACHRDLYLCHVFVELDARGSHPPRFTLIDLARTFRPTWRRTRWLVKDLAQLDVSARECGATRTDRLRCLLAYLGLQRRAARARWYARKVSRKSDRILRRIMRKARGAAGPGADGGRG
jgi:heptose I phosphotransferase